MLVAINCPEVDEDLRIRPRWVKEQSTRFLNNKEIMTIVKKIFIFPLCTAFTTFLFIGIKEFKPKVERLIVKSRVCIVSCVYSNLGIQTMVEKAFPIWIGVTFSSRPLFAL